MDAQEQLERNSVPKKPTRFYKSTIIFISLHILTLIYNMMNSTDYFKLTCAVSLSTLSSLLLHFKCKVLWLEVENPLKALKLRRLCLCVIYAISFLLDMLSLCEGVDRISRSVVLVGFKLLQIFFILVNEKNK
jgi:hypothetical protein